MSTGRSDFPLVPLSDGSVLAAAGYLTLPNGDEYLQSAETYELATGTWAPTGNLAYARRAPTGTRLQDGRVLVAGGDSPNWYIGPAELYAPATRTWSTIGSLVTPRGYHTATLLNDGQVLLAGGLGPVGNSPSWNLSAAEIFDPNTGTFMSVPGMADMRSHHTATLLADGRVLVVGGYGSSTILASAELFDPVTMAWTPTGSLNRARTQHYAERLADGRVLVAGGRNAWNQPDPANTAELYDPATGTWSMTGSLTTKRVFMGGSALAQGTQVLLVGGLNDHSGSYLNSAERYDAATGTWSSVQLLLRSRGFHGLAPLPGGWFLVAGGWDNENLSSAEVYHPGNDCHPTTCAAQGATCGTLLDGCGGTLSCGTCDSGYTCSSNACVLAPSPPPEPEPLTYSASNTSSAQQNTVNQLLTLTAGDVLEVGTCGLPGATASGDTYLRLFSEEGFEVASNDDSCGLASFIQYTAPTSGTYELRAGCFSSNGCSGTVVFRRTPNPTP